MSDNISRFPYSASVHCPAAPVEHLTPAMLAQRRRRHLERMRQSGRDGRAAVAAEVEKLNAAYRERCGIQTSKACREDAIRRVEDALALRTIDAEQARAEFRRADLDPSEVEGRIAEIIPEKNF